MMKPPFGGPSDKGPSNSAAPPPAAQVLWLPSQRGALLCLRWAARPVPIPSFTTNHHYCCIGHSVPLWWRRRFPGLAAWGERVSDLPPQSASIIRAKYSWDLRICDEQMDGGGYCATGELITVSAASADGSNSRRAALSVYGAGGRGKRAKG